MVKRMLIDALHPEETRVVIADEKQIYDFDFVSTAKKQLKGNIYLAKITRVEPSLQAAFVEYGGGKQGFLPFAEIHPDYYQIPMQDRKRLLEEAAGESYDTSDSAPTGAEGTEPASASDMPDGEAQQAFNAELPPAIDEGAVHPDYLTQGAIDETQHEEFNERSAHESSEAHEQQDIGTNDLANAETCETGPMPQPEGEGAHEPKHEEHASSEGVETLPSEEEEIRQKKSNFSRRYKIQEVIRRGQVVLVQVIKEERGNKGSSLTTYLSLAGRYCVLMPNSPKDGGISRKIMSPEDRKRLKAITNELRLANGMSVIIRTAGMERTRAEIKRDYDYLVKVWNGIRETTLESTAPALIYEESNIIKRAIRDQYTSDIDELVIEGDDGYSAAKDFMKLLLASHTPKIKHYKEATPLFYAYNIEDQLLSMHDPVVKLRSGGYIVINPTEALISIDVNSGRSTGERNIEETAVKTNLEAAAEVARQLRLRDLAGLIVIDFIDMLESRNRRAVERMLKDSLKMDRAKIQLGRISPFGLLEMSRQRLRPSISETSMVTCPHCTGRGYIRSNDSMSIQLIRAIEKEASSGNWGTLKVNASMDVALHLLNTKRDIIRAIEERYDITILIAIDPKLPPSDFNLEKMRKAQGGERGGERNAERGERGERAERGERRSGRGRERDPRQQQREYEQQAIEAANDDTAEISEEGGSNIEEVATEEGGEGAAGERRRSRRRRGRRGGRDRERQPGDRQPGDRAPHAPAAAGDDAGNDNAANVSDAGNENEAGAEGAEQTGEGQTGERRRRQRGGRGRRRWRDRDGKPEGQEGSQPAEGGSSEQPAAAVNAPQPEQRPASPPPATRNTSDDAKSLPQFTRESAVAPPPPPPPAEVPVQREANASGKKGWWQKMIELDD